MPGFKKEEVELDEISPAMQDRYYKKAGKQRDASQKKIGDPGFPNVQKKHKDRAARRNKGMGSVIKRDQAGHSDDQRYITKPSSAKRARTGAKGHSLTTKKSSDLHKTMKVKRKGTDKISRVSKEKGKEMIGKGTHVKEDAVDMATARISRQKKANAQRHDGLMDRARLKKARNKVRKARRTNQRTESVDIQFEEYLKNV